MRDRRTVNLQIGFSKFRARDKKFRRDLSSTLTYKSTRTTTSFFASEAKREP